MSNDLTVRPQGVISTYDDVERAATAMAASGFFQDSQKAAQAVVKILAGSEMGFGAFASMTGVYIISGKPSFGANMMAAAVKRSGKYDYRVLEMTDTVCEIAYYQGTVDIGHSRFTIEDARKAGTKNLDKFPRNMLFARAMSNGVRWFTPDVFMGAAVYTPEELGANVDEEGKPVDLKFTELAPKSHTAGVEYPPAPAPAQPVKVEPVAVEITQAVIDAEMSSDGVTLYNSITTPKLVNMGNSMLRKLNAGEYADGELVEKSRKLAVIDAILINRQEAQ